MEITFVIPETDGSNDVMITAEASGSKATSGALAFTFSHLLTQLQFTFKAGAGFPSTGKKVTSISIKNQQTPASLNINTGAITYNPAGSGFTLTGSYDISADPGTTATVYPMVKSGATSVVLDIIADGVTYTGVTVPLTTETGYLIQQSQCGQHEPLNGSRRRPQLCSGSLHFGLASSAQIFD